MRAKWGGKKLLVSDAKGGGEKEIFCLVKGEGGGDAVKIERQSWPMCTRR